MRFFAGTVAVAVLILCLAGPASARTGPVSLGTAVLLRKLRIDDPKVVPLALGPGIVGAEIEGSYLGDTEHKVNGGKLKEKWRGAIKAKAGLTFDQTLVYGTAGYAMTNYKKGGDVRNDVGFKGGYLVGAGIEQAFAGGLSAKLEYNYIMTPDVRTSAVSGSSEKDINSHVIKAGINMRF